MNFFYVCSDSFTPQCLLILTCISRLLLTSVNLKPVLMEASTSHSCKSCRPYHQCVKVAKCIHPLTKKLDPTHCGQCQAMILLVRTHDPVAYRNFKKWTSYARNLRKQRGLVLSPDDHFWQSDAIRDAHENLLHGQDLSVTVIIS